MPESYVLMASQSSNGSNDAKNQIRNHYNDAIRGANETQHVRSTSKHLALRQMCNYSKAVLINHTCKRWKDSMCRTRAPVRVLDVGCGRGGDLNKWSLNSAKMKIGYRGTDISEVRIESARIRYANMHRGGRHNLKSASFTVSDMTTMSDATNDGDARVQSLDHCGVLCFMFSLHYGFENEYTMNNMIRRIAGTLDCPGMCIGTVVNTTRLLQLITDSGTTDGQWKNDICHIELGTKLTQQLHSGDLDVKTCGLSYTFSLESSLEFCDEYAIPDMFWVALCNTLGETTTVNRVPFCDWIQVARQNEPMNEGLYSKMCPNIHLNPHHAAALQVCELYDVFVICRSHNSE